MSSMQYYWLWLVNIPMISRKTIYKLLSHFKTPEHIYYADHRELSLFLNEKQLQAFAKSRNREKIVRMSEQLEEKNISFLYYGSQDYPEMLFNISDAPLGLYLKGKMPDKRTCSIAIIGARECTEYGKEMALYFGRELATRGVNVISGLARGIDGFAHKGALRANGYTMGVLGGGIDRIYPRDNYKLFMEMEKTGGILSESNIGIDPYPFLFPERNRIIAGLSDGILVVEAKEKSGTLITVDEGLEQGKDIFVIPGRILDQNSVGCNNLIKLGAIMVTEVEDILNYYKIKKNTEVKLNDGSYTEEVMKKMSLAPIEKMVYSCLEIEPKYLDDIISQVKLAPQDVCMALNHLVLLDIVKETAVNYYGIKIG